MNKPIVVPEVKIDGDSIRFYFAGAMHVAIKRTRLLGIRSWRKAELFFVEFTMETGAAITVEYDIREKWLAVLAALDGLIAELFKKPESAHA